MGKIDDFAALYHEDRDPNDLVELARFVRTMEGARRFRSAIGAVIQGGARPVPTARPSSSAAVPVTTNDFNEQVAKLKKSLSKLDEQSIRGILKDMEDSKNLPRNKKYDIIKEMLENFLKERLQKGVNAARYTARNTARSAKDKATGQG